KLGREKFILATKSMNRTYEGIKGELEISLKNLKVDYIDLYQFHNVRSMEDYSKLMAEDGAYNYALKAKEQGLIKHIGISSHSADVLKVAVETDYFETIQFPYNAVERQGEEVFK